MAQIVNFTAQPVLVTASTMIQNLWEAIDISGSDVLDLELGVVASSGSQSSSIGVSLITSMQRQVDDSSWVTPATNFASLANPTTLPSWQIQTFNMGLLRYVRWKVTSLGGLTNMTLSLRGMGRKYGT